MSYNYSHVFFVNNLLHEANNSSVIRQECGQTLGRVRVRTDIGQ